MDRVAQATSIVVHGTPEGGEIGTMLLGAGIALASSVIMFLVQHVAERMRDRQRKQESRKALAEQKTEELTGLLYDAQTWLNSQMHSSQEQEKPSSLPAFLRPLFVVVVHHFSEQQERTRRLVNLSYEILHVNSQIAKKKAEMEVATIISADGLRSDLRVLRKERQEKHEEAIKLLNSWHGKYPPSEESSPQ